MTENDTIITSNEFITYYFITYKVVSFKYSLTTRAIFRAKLPNELTPNYRMNSR